MVGASGYLIKPATPQDVVNAVTEAVNGGNFLCRQAQRTIAASFGRCATDQALHGFLSPREQEILACLFRNLLDKEIGEELHISTGTVHSHLVRLFRKLGVHSPKNPKNFSFFFFCFLPPQSGKSTLSYRYPFFCLLRNQEGGSSKDDRLLPENVAQSGHVFPPGPDLCTTAHITTPCTRPPESIQQTCSGSYRWL